MRPYATLVAPADTDDTSATWGANCGPCALAAALGVPVARVQGLFPDFAHKPWVNPSTMWTALAMAGCSASKRGEQWPSYGLAFVQWHGPWLNAGVPVTVAYQYTHWIAVAQTVEYDRVIYDINATAAHDFMGAWVPFPWWEQEVVSQILATVPRASGAWTLRWTCDLHGNSTPKTP